MKKYFILNCMSTVSQGIAWACAITACILFLDVGFSEKVSLTEFNASIILTFVFLVLFALGQLLTVIGDLYLSFTGAIEKANRAMCDD